MHSSASPTAPAPALLGGRTELVLLRTAYPQPSMRRLLNRTGIQLTVGPIAVVGIVVQSLLRLRIPLQCVLNQQAALRLRLA
ncbi:MAG: hypothetical protein JWR07_5117 [Nevskia sp.]|nr:hypothetical protein [Nevskia sp.]